MVKKNTYAAREREREKRERGGRKREREVDGVMKSNVWVDLFCCFLSVKGLRGRTNATKANHSAGKEKRTREKMKNNY